MKWISAWLILAVSAGSGTARTSLAAPFLTNAAVLESRGASAKTSNESRLPAFPGAEGFGGYTPGGRFGRVLVVTTLADFNPRTEKPIQGSFRAAIDAEGPRTIVFAVSGNIDLKAEIVLQNPYADDRRTNLPRRRLPEILVSDGQRESPRCDPPLPTLPTGRLLQNHGGWPAPDRLSQRYR